MYTFEEICEGCIYALFAPVPGNEEEIEHLGVKQSMRMPAM